MHRPSGPSSAVVSVSDKDPSGTFISTGIVGVVSGEPGKVYRPVEKRDPEPSAVKGDRYVRTFYGLLCKPSFQGSLRVHRGTPRDR